MMASTKGDLLQQASHIWKMLDELADSDPEAYKNFIKKNTEESKQVSDLPKPAMCVKTKILGTSETEIFINICSWSRVPRPSSDTAPISITGGPLEEEKDNKAHFKITRVAINPYVIEECLKDSTNLNMLIELIINYLQEEQKLSISKQYTICHDKKYHGELSELKSFYSSRKKSQDEMMKESILDMTPETILSQLGKLSTSDGDNFKQSEPNEALKLPGKDCNSSKKLIEEISCQEVRLTEPSYEMKLKEADGRKSKRIVLRVSLPDVDSVEECELQITKTFVHLLVKDKFQLDFPLPETIVETQASAKFISKQSVLTITLPLPT